MNNLTTTLNNVFSPQMAIIVYSGSDNSGVYLEQRDIVEGKMCAGRPLSKKCITDIIKTIAEDSDNIAIGYHGIIPENLLYADTTTGKFRLVWYNPPQKRKMYFIKELGIPDGEVLMPGILYSVSDNQLYVYAFKGKTPKDKLFQAPFFNVNNHSVCLGSAKAKKPVNLTYIEAMEYWETMFWTSEFSHLYGDNPIDGNLAVVTKNCIKKDEPFPTKLLKLSKIRLKDILK